MNSTTNAAQYFDALGCNWQRVTQLCGPARDHFVVFGGLIVKLRFADTLLYEAYSPAFGRAHLAQAPDHWHAEICIWSNRPGCELPAPAWASGDHIARGEIPSLSDANIRSVYNIQSSVFNSYCSISKLGFHCVRDFDKLPQYELGAPIRDILSWVLLDHGAQLVHAGAVGYASGGVLLVGRGGSGKSTTATSCLGGPLKYLADDYCLLRKSEGGWSVNSVFDTCKLYPSDAEKNAVLNNCESSYSAETGKQLFYIKRDLEKHTCSGFPLKAIVLPKVTPGAAAQSYVNSINSSRAIQALAPSTLFQLPSSRAKSFGLMSSAVKAVPAFELALGSDRKKVGDALVELLGQVQR
ncbi:MAG: hypothetical protein V7711_01525 [Pseudomonadales bacterium]